MGGSPVARATAKEVVWGAAGFLIMLIRAAPAALTALAVAAFTPCIEDTEPAVFPSALEVADCGAALVGTVVLGTLVLEIEGALVAAAVLEGIAKEPDVALVVEIVLRGARRVEIGGAAFVVVVLDLGGAAVAATSFDAVVEVVTTATNLEVPAKALGDVRRS